LSDQLAASPLLAELRQATEEAATQTSELLRQLDSAPPSERRALLTAHVRLHLAKVLGLKPSDPIDLDRGFFDLGMDSLTSAELRNRLQASLGRPLPATLAFDYPTGNALIGHLSKLLSPDPAPAAPPTAGGKEQAVQTRARSEVEELSPEQLRAMLAQKIAALSAELEASAEGD
jgi:acyl carrier protein